MRKLSLLTPPEKDVSYRMMSKVTFHDLGFDVICKNLAQKDLEEDVIRGFMSQLTDDGEVTTYRCDIFEDILRYPDMRDRMLALLEKIDFLKSYGTFKTNYDEASGAWNLLHRLGELKDYITYVNELYSCLSENDIHSRGLIEIRDYFKTLFEDQGFAELEKDIAGVKATTDNLKSVTLGVNLNDRFEAESIGVVSINSKPFKKAGILSNFSEKISREDKVEDTAEWKEDYRYIQAVPEDSGSTATVEHMGKMQLMVSNPLLAATMGGVPEKDEAKGTMQYMDRIANRLINISVKRLQDILKKYISVSLADISGLIPEFIYYIRWAEYIESLQKQGVSFAKPEVSPEDTSKRLMHAEGIFNLKLMEKAAEDMTQVVGNDLDFDENRVFILTGANRGGKTTITQAVGQMFVLAQGGIFVPGKAFLFHPVDQIFTHFPADEDKTFDLGRLGEECQRFRELYGSCTKNSLLLLNETFSTTSFEEGYYIAHDAVRAIAKAGIRTIYNTHMHKLGYEAENFNQEETDGKVASMIVESENGSRSYKVKLAPPEGDSHARDIARKYGVTFEQLQSV